jgi:ribosomal-protein-alanine N-acetyltransferase
MTYIDLIQINLQGSPVSKVGALDNIAQQVCAATASLYVDAGFVLPWVGYLAQKNGKVVGACAFKAPPLDGKVEIGYFTFPDSEGKGIATLMVRQLLEIVQKEQAALIVVAHTANEENASNAILRNLGFRFVHVLEHPEYGEMWEWHLVNEQSVSESQNV